MDIWRSEASCVGVEVSVFFPADDFSHPELTAAERTALNAENLLRARLICSDCPVRTACLAYAESSDQEHGVYAGMTPEQRRNLFRRSDKRASAGRRAPGQGSRRRHTKASRLVRDFTYGASLREVSTRYGVAINTVVTEVRRHLAQSDGNAVVAQ